MQRQHKNNFLILEGAIHYYKIQLIGLTHQNYIKLCYNVEYHLNQILLVTKHHSTAQLVPEQEWQDM